MTAQDAYFTAALAMLAACVILLAALLRRLRRAAERLEQERSAVESRLQTVLSRLADMEARVAELEEDAGVLVPPEPPRSGLNLARRREALSRLRRGESPAHVALAMGLPAGELELLGKVQKMLLAADRGMPPRSARTARAPVAGEPTQAGTDAPDGAHAEAPAS